MASYEAVTGRYADAMDSLFPLAPIAPGPPHQPHSATSRAAAESVAEITGAMRRQVYAWIQGCGAYGSTDEETEDGTGLKGSTVRPRRIELEAKGFIRKAGHQRTTRAGRAAEVYVA